MLILIIPLSWFAFLIVVTVAKPNWGWRLALLRSTAIFSSYIVLSTEFLSLLHAISIPWVFLIWFLPFLLSSLWIYSHVGKVKSHLGEAIQSISLSWSDVISLVLVFLVLVITGVVARLAPPNTWDSLNTHMSRVAHWAQNSSLNPFATGIELQNFYPPFPGIAILHSYVLTQSDHWANFAQWTAMLVSLIGVSFLAKRFGASRMGQWMAVLFTASLPMGIAQASSTMTDYLVALWLILVAVECELLRGQKGVGEPVLFLSVAAALAVNTKTIAIAYLVPFALYAAIILIKGWGLKRLFLSASICLLIIVTINGGYFGRNVLLFENPIGPQNRINYHSNDVLGWRTLVSNTLKNASLHAWSPFPSLNTFTFKGLIKSHLWLEMEIGDPRTSIETSYLIQTPSTDENRAGNFFHAVFILVAFLIGFVSKKESIKRLRVYLLLVISTFLLFSYVFKVSVFGSRYHMAFFVLFAPAIGLILSEYLSVRIQTIVGVGIVLTSWNWLTGIDSRPLIAKEIGGVSILSTPRADMLFSGVPEYSRNYQLVSQIIQEQECHNVGIAIGGATAEYPFWVYLGAPDDDLRIEWIVGGTPSAKYSNKDITLCAAICDGTCPSDWSEVRGLPLRMEASGLWLYMESP